jgi:hypothetical protein
MRLIDADELLTRIRLNYNNHQNISAGAMKDIINTTKTAYDVDKVVEELREADEGYCWMCGGGIDCKTVTDIVRKGGME